MTDLWGSRFKGELDAGLRRFSSSLAVDRRLAHEDVACSRAHAECLRDAGLLPAGDFDKLSAALAQVEAEITAGTFPPLPSTQSSSDPASAAAGVAGADQQQAGLGDLPEDIHSAIEARLVALCGDAARRLHAGRSRNDQIATDVLLWLKEASAEVEGAVRSLQWALLDAAEANADRIIFAYTHLQRAQPVLLAHHLLAHVEALDRDIGRLQDARTRADRSPLGAGACAGSSLPLDREASARRLGFARVARNSIDAVSDRDWAVEFVSACALIVTHLSRLAEEIVLWTTSEFATARLSDSWSTGSSMMPQKRNPDVAELVRGKAARVQGDLVTLLSLLKGLPLAYNRDLQEDKEPLFDAADTTRVCALMLAGALAGITFNEPRAAGPDFSAATDLAEELVRRGMPFRAAHERIGRLVAGCEAAGRGLPDATDAELAEAGLDGIDRTLLTPRGGIRAKRTAGSTHPDEVARALADARRRIGR